MQNLITDVSGLKVGHADDARLASGVTAFGAFGLCLCGPTALEKVRRDTWI